MRLALFRGAEGGNTKQGFAGESFKQGLIFGRFHVRNKAVWKLFKDGHELRYPGPGDAEVVARGGLCSLRIFDQIFPHLDGHGPRCSCKPALALVGEVAKDRIN